MSRVGYGLDNSRCHSVGAAIAMSTSLIVEIRKGRHDTESEWRRTRREIYAEYLTVLSQARWELSGVAANSELSDPARRATANEIFARATRYGTSFSSTLPAAC